MKNGNGCKRGETHLYFNAKNIVSTTLEKTHILSVLIPLRYLWIQGLQEGATPQVVYVPTEAGLPILEAGRTNGK